MADRDAEALKIHARDAVKFAAGSVTLPILYAEIGQPPHPLASGVLLEADQRLFILTAAHIFDGCDLARFYVPAGPIQGSLNWIAEPRSKFRAGKASSCQLV